MPNEPYERYTNNTANDEEYRLKMEARAQRRKKRQRQRILLLAAFAAAVIIFIVCIIWVFSALFGSDEPASSVSSSAPSSVSSVAQSGPGVSWPVAADPNVWNLILVNNQRPLPDGFTVDTVPVTVIGHHFDARAADSLTQMVDACNAVSGNSLAVYSGYRGTGTQNDNHQYMIDMYMGQGKSEAEAVSLANLIEPVAGYSEHQTGLAVDFITGTLNTPSIEFAQTPEFAWLLENAADYGFILRYSSEKEHITGFTVQPYHFRYVGVEDAQIITAAGICLEEYLAVLPESTTQSAAGTSAVAGSSAS